MGWEHARAGNAPSAITKLAYSLPAFGPRGYDGVTGWVRSVVELGFSTVVLHPTYPVCEDDAGELRIDTADAPDVPAAVCCVRQSGLRLRLEPHLDWQSTLHGGPYRWRQSMLLHPSRQYLDEVLFPLAALAPDELTLGSELDISLADFTADWQEVAALLSSYAELGHKINHDADKARRRSSTYLQQLAYRAVSFYPSGNWHLPPGWTIGEFGLGSPDISRPWHFDAAAFQTEEHFRVRRDYYLRLLDWLQLQDPMGRRAAAFWTCGHFDVLGVMNPEWRDDAVVERVLKIHASP